MAKRRVFYSFHYARDSWRAGQVKNMGVVEGNTPVSSNEWEQVKRKGDEAIKKWINDTMYNRSCVIVLIGSETASRKWCNYEIEHAWKEGKGIVGVFIHGLENVLGEQGQKGKNPFENFYVDKTINYIKKRDKALDSNEIKLSAVCKAYNAPYLSSKNIYSYIKENIDSWVEEAIKIRNNYPK